MCLANKLDWGVLGVGARRKLLSFSHVQFCLPFGFLIAETNKRMLSHKVEEPGGKHKWDKLGVSKMHGIGIYFLFEIKKAL